MAILIAILAGLLLGSFLSVLLARWPHWLGAVSGRSQCPHCRHRLAWNDLVPLASWFVLRGSCRYCQEPIAMLYPVLELTMASVFAVFAWTHPISSIWFGIDYAVLFALVALFFFDLKYRILPDIVLLSLAVMVVVRLVAQQPDHLVNAFSTGVILAGLWGALYGVSRGRWLGLGDVKLAFVIGLLFGYPIAVSVMLIAIWSGALVGVGLVLTNRATMRTALPFGSFWVAIAILAILVPNPIAFMSGLFFPVF